MSSPKKKVVTPRYEVKTKNKATKARMSGQDNKVRKLFTLLIDQSDATASAQGDMISVAPVFCAPLRDTAEGHAKLKG